MLRAAQLAYEYRARLTDSRSSGQHKQVATFSAPLETSANLTTASQFDGLICVSVRTVSQSVFGSINGQLDKRSEFDEK